MRSLGSGRLVKIAQRDCRSTAHHCKIQVVTIRTAAVFLKVVEITAAARGGCENLRGKTRRRDSSPVIIFGVGIAI
jgi:hypothetical protein